MPEAWANEGPVQHDFDMEPDGNYKLKVSINRACNAIEAGNSNANGKALSVTVGQTEILDQTVISKNIAANTLLITNIDLGGNARALNVNGPANINVSVAQQDNHTTLNLWNGSAEENGKALAVSGRTEMNHTLDDPVLRVTNPAGIALNPDARSITAEGAVEIKAGGAGTPTLLLRRSSIKCLETEDEGDQIHIAAQNDEEGLFINDRTEHHPYAVDVQGGLGVVNGALFDFGDVQIGNEHESSLRVLGDVEVYGMLKSGANKLEIEEATIRTVNQETLNIATELSSGDLEISRTGRPTTIHGSLSVGEDTQLDGELKVTDKVLVGPNAAAGSIDAGGSPNSQNLRIGTGASTADVIIGKQDQVAVIDCNLRVGRSVVDMIHVSRIDAYGNNGNPDHLSIGTLEHTTGLALSRAGQPTRVRGSMEVEEELLVGPNADAGFIDAGGTPNAQNLNIGAQNTTATVAIGRAGQDVNVVEDLNVFGGLKVGPTGDNGLIDSNGVAVAQRKLKIGSGAGTSDVMLSRAGQTIDMFGQERLNSNACILNGANNITDATGIGFIVNAVGLGNGPSIDFYVNDAVQGWLDTTGFVNA